MRKLSALLLALLLTTTAVVAFADPAPAALPEGVITEVFDGDTLDIDGDGQAETVRYSVSEDPGTGATSFRLVIGGTQLDGDGDWLTGRLHMLRLPESTAEETLLLLSDYGMSDDDTTWVYAWNDGSVRFVGALYTMPWDLTVTGPNTLSGTVRGSILCTWYRPADYVLGVTNGLNENWEYVGRVCRSVCEVPRSEYPMGFSVTVTRELTLQVSPTNAETACVIPAGAAATIVSTDDVEWLYVVPDERDWSYDWPGGWLRVQQHGYTANIGGETVQTQDLFTGLWYAD